uniref:Ig-like domain-containing protein n=1 Tax=Periophthalmus magnuspinnatus TaxID=409849 RepID=A0A3B4BDE9_9GOBI
MRGIGALSFLVEPSVKLLLAPRDESGYQTLLCTAWGFDPHIEWISETQRSSGSKVSISLNADGRVVVSSELQVPQTEWKTGKVYSCQVSDKSLNRINKENVSVCAGNVSNSSRTYESTIVYLIFFFLSVTPPASKVVGVYLSPLDPVSLDCLVSGFYPPEVIIFWEKNGIRIPSSSQTNAPVWKDKDNVKYSTSSHLNIFNTLDENSTYSCVVRHESSPAPFTSTITDVFGMVWRRGLSDTTPGNFFVLRRGSDVA